MRLVAPRATIELNNHPRTLRCHADKCSKLHAGKTIHRANGISVWRRGRGGHEASRSCPSGGVQACEWTPMQTMAASQPLTGLPHTQLGTVKDESHTYQERFWVSGKDPHDSASVAHQQVQCFADRERKPNTAVDGGDVDLVATRMARRQSALVGPARDPAGEHSRPCGGCHGQVCQTEAEDGSRPVSDILGASGLGWQRASRGG